jgi:hypothetical protein
MTCSCLVFCNHNIQLNLRSIIDYTHSILCTLHPAPTMSDPCSHNRDMSTCCVSCLLKRVENDQCMACGISNNRNTCSDECQKTITASMVRLYEENRILQVKYDALKANVAVRNHAFHSPPYSPPYSPLYSPLYSSSYSPSYQLPNYHPQAPPYSPYPPVPYATTFHCPTAPNYCPPAPCYGTPYKSPYVGGKYEGTYDPIRSSYNDAKIAEYSAQSPQPSPQTSPQPPTKKSRVSP